MKYELKKSFQYSHKGDTEKAQFIEVKEPTYKQIQYVSKIKQQLMNALHGLSSDAETSSSEQSSGDTTLTGAQAMQILYSSKETIAPVFTCMAEILRACAVIDGSEGFTAVYVDRLSAADFEGITGDYIANFITPSLLDGL